jgi:2,4-dichlorophenol 6-monooxygenase
LQEAFELKNFEFNAQGVELNQRYVSGAVITDPTVGAETFERDPQLYLQATTRPGAKVPHAWLVDEKGRRISTLDATGKGRFTVITGLAGRAWVHAVDTLDLPYLATVVTGATGTKDPYFAWAQVREVHEAGAVLVRPDGYVAWRQTAPVWDDDATLEQLRAALDSVLCRGLDELAGAAAVQITTDAVTL